jgi:general secretion pathway protein G
MLPKVPQRGFTLIELMVVISIMGILMAAGIVMFTNAQKKSRDAKRRADVDALAKAIEQYYQNNGNYFRASAGANSTSANWTGTWQTTLGGYFPSGKLPLDPINDSTYNYEFRARLGADGPPATFCVGATLETPNGNCTAVTDPAIPAGTYSDPGWGKCVFVTAGTGTMHCAQYRQ